MAENMAASTHGGQQGGFITTIMADNMAANIAGGFITTIMADSMSANTHGGQ
jgi:hypothetical protein